MGNLPPTTTSDPTPGHFYQTVPMHDTLLNIAASAYGAKRGMERVLAARRINNSNNNTHYYRPATQIESQMYLSDSVITIPRRRSILLFIPLPKGNKPVTEKRTHDLPPATATPIPGQFYIPSPGESLLTIASAAYEISKTAPDKEFLAGVGAIVACAANSELVLRETANGEDSLVDSDAYNRGLVSRIFIPLLDASHIVPEQATDNPTPGRMYRPSGSHETIAEVAQRAYSTLLSWDGRASNVFENAIILHQKNEKLALWDLDAGDPLRCVYIFIPVCDGDSYAIATEMALGKIHSVAYHQTEGLRRCVKEPVREPDPEPTTPLDAIESHMREARSQLLEATKLLHNLDTPLRETIGLVAFKAVREIAFGLCSLELKGDRGTTP